MYYCIVLKEWLLLPNALRPFQIYCAPPNLRITRTWICRLKFVQRYFFQTWGSLMSLKSQTRETQLKVPPEGLVLRIFTSWKIHRPQPGLNPRTLDLEASNLPQEHRGRQVLCYWKSYIAYFCQLQRLKLQNNISYKCVN